MGRRLKTILYIIGILLLIESVFVFLCIPFSLYYGGEDFPAIILSGLCIALTGFLCWIPFRKKRREIDKRMAFLIVSLIWIIASVFGALPYLLSGTITDFTDAFFEAMSGFTTTGASVIADIESAPKGIIFWRALTQWIGGMGIIVLVITFIPFLGINSMSLYSAEVSGPSKDKLHPHMLTSARRLWITYASFTILTIILLLLGGINLFEAMANTFSTVSTGGFGIKGLSVADYSPYIQYVLVFAMLVSSFNYSLNYFLLKGKFKKVLNDEELRVYLIMILLATLFTVVMLLFQTSYSVEEAIRHGLFQVVSITSTTGLVSADYTLWPVSVSFLFLILMFCGGMAGSTSGGMKIVRIIVLFKNCKYVLTNIVHSRAFFPVRINGKPLQENVIANVMAFFLIYIGVFTVGTILFIALGINVLEALGATASAMCSFGPGFGPSGGFGNYEHFPELGKWLYSFLMLVGRLELMTIFILFFPPYWKK